MSARRSRFLAVALLAALVPGACSSGGSSLPTAPGPTAATDTPSPSPTPQLTKLEQAQAHIEHVIFIVQENRSFDHYFGTYPGADGIPMKNGKPTACIPNPWGSRCARPYHSSSQYQDGGPHSHHAAVVDINGGKMDGFLNALGQAKDFCHVTTTQPGCRKKLGPQDQADVLSYHTRADIPNY